MREFGATSESPSDSINQQFRKIQASQVDQLELGFPDLEEPKVVVEEKDAGPKGKKNPTPVLSDLIQISLQSVGFPYAPVGSPLLKTHIFMDGQRRRHNRVDVFTSRSPQQLSGVR